MRRLGDFLAERGQPYREDPTNANLKRTRARIRHDLLPKLACEYNRDVAGALIRLGALAAAAGRAFDGDLRQLERRASLIASQTPSCSTDPF